MNPIFQELRQKQFEELLQTDEYQTLLKDVTKDIIRESKQSNSESTTATIFEIELLTFIRDVTGSKFYPTKELLVDTERHITKGRIDARIGAVVIEYKHYGKLQYGNEKESASVQLKEYLSGLYAKEGNNYFGIITDGVIAKTIEVKDGIYYEGEFADLSVRILDFLVRNIASLSKKALTSKNLVDAFASNSDNSVSKSIPLDIQ